MKSGPAVITQCRGISEPLSPSSRMGTIQRPIFRSERFRPDEFGLTNSVLLGRGHQEAS